MDPLKALHTTAGQEPNPLQQDLAHLKAVAANPQIDPLTRGGAAKGAVFLEWFLTEGMPRLAAEAERLGVSSWAESLPEADISRLVAMADDAQRLTLLSSYPQLDRDRLQQDPSYRMVVSFAIADELCRHQTLNESANGREVRLFLVEEGERPERLEKLACKASGGLWLHSDRVKGKEDATSEAKVAILEETSRYLQVEPIVFNAEALLAVMQGQFNETIDRARRRIRTQVETELRRLQNIHVAPSESFKGASGHALLVEQLPIEPDPREQLEKKLLVEQLLVHSGLDEEDKRLVRLRFLEDKTQDQLARETGLTQSAVSKRLEKALGRLRQLMDSQAVSSTNK